MAIRLRAIGYRDLPQLKSWRNDDQLRSTFREHRLLNMLNQDDWFHHISRSREVEMFGIQGDVLEGVCGLCNIHWVFRTAEVSIYVPDKQRPWLGLEALGLLRSKAFEEFNLHRLWTEIYEFDLSKIGLFQQAGYVLEGTLRQHVFKLGKYHDSLMYGLLRC